MDVFKYIWLELMLWSICFCRIINNIIISNTYCFCNKAKENKTEVSLRYFFHSLKSKYNVRMDIKGKEYFLFGLSIVVIVRIGICSFDA